MCPSMKETIKFPSIVEDMPDADYRLVDALNWSSLKHLNDCPAKFFLERRDPKPPTEAMKFGTAYHCYALERKIFRSRYKVIPKMVRRGKEWDLVCQEAALENRQLVFEHERDLMGSMAKVFDAHTFVNGMMGNSRREVCVFWRHRGIKCKGKVDILNEKLRLIADLKTTTDCKPDKFMPEILKRGYDQQMAFYIDGLASNRIYVDSFVIFAQSTERPYGVWAYEGKREEIDAARVELDKLFKLYEACNEANYWPLYPEVLTRIQIPKFIKEKREKGESYYAESD